MKGRTDIIFLVIALTLVAGVPTTLYSIYYFADSVELIAALILAALLIVALLGILVAYFRDAIVSYIFRAPIELVKSVGAPAGDALDAYIDGDRELARSRLERFIENLASHYAWFQTRRWIMASAAGLLLGFAGLVGSALLKQQNDLILDQNRFFQQQIDQQQRQLELQQSVANQSVRSEAIRRIYGPEFSDTPRVKAEAVRSLVVVERARIVDGVNTLPTDFINLHDAMLERAWLDSADLRKIAFRGAQLGKANFNSSDLTEAVFRFADVTAATFIQAKLTDSNLMFTAAPDSVFTGADMRGAHINHTDLSGADLSSANIAGATLIKVNLEGADISRLGAWREIENLSGTNIAGVRNAPEGFYEWALDQGAIDEPGALSDLMEQAATQRALEETSSR